MSTTGAVSEAVGKVEADLASFWKSAVDDNGTQKARAATMNFVSVSGPAELDQLKKQMEELAETRAGRVFLMTVDPRLAPWDLEHDVSAVCHKEGDIVVCYDRVELRFGAMAAVRAASVLSALSLSEVPTLVEVSRGAPAVLADALAKAADRVVIDSAHTSVARIADLSHKTSAPFADRAFVRTFTWRELTARFFDDAPEAAKAVRKVTITRTHAGKQDPAALVLGWLASRLGWKLEARDKATDAAGEAVSIELKEPTGDFGAGELTGIELSTKLGDKDLELSVVRKDGERCVVWSRSGARTDRHEHALGFRDEGWVLQKCVDSTESDAVYRAAALAAAEWSAK